MCNPFPLSGYPRDFDETKSALQELIESRAWESGLGETEELDLSPNSRKVYEAINGVASRLRLVADNTLRSQDNSCKLLS